MFDFFNVDNINTGHQNAVVVSLVTYWVQYCRHNLPIDTDPFLLKLET